MKSPTSPLLDLFATLTAPQLAAVPDANLLARFVRTQDGGAFAEVVRRYGPMVWRTVRAAGNRADAEDAFQATFLALVRHAEAVRQPAALAGWLHRTARRAAVRARRSTPAVALADVCGEADDPLDRLTARELLAAVDEEIAALPESFRTVLLVCGVDGLSVRDAARRLGWSAGSVKGRLERARVRLRRRLAARGLPLSFTLAVVALPPGLAAAALAVAQGHLASPRVVRLAAAPSLRWKAVVLAALAGGGLAVMLGSDAPRAVQVPVAPPPRPVERLVLWSIPNPNRDRLKPGDWFGSNKAVWSPDGKHVVTPGFTPSGREYVGEVRILEPATGRIAEVLAVGDGRLLAYGGPSVPVAISSDGATVVASGYRYPPGGEVHTWKQFVFVWDRANPGKPRLELGTTDAVVSVVFHPTGRSFFTLCPDTGRLAGWDAKTGKRLFEALTPSRDDQVEQPGNTRALGLACHPSGKFLVVIQNNFRLSTWDARTGECVAVDKFPADASGMWPAFSPDGKTLVVAGHLLHDRGVVTATAWDVDADAVGSPLRNGRSFAAASAVEKYGGVKHAAFSPDGRLVALAGSDNVVRVLDWKAERIVGESGEHKGNLYNAAFSPDGKWLLTAGEDSTKVWSVAELLKRPAR